MEPLLGFVASRHLTNRQAIALGLEVLPCRFQVTPEGIQYLGLAECKFS